MLIQSLILILGFFLLIKGADWLVDGASALAKKYNVSDLTIGLTVVAFGTSAPELAVNSFASIFNHQDIVFGNVIGSNNFNLFFILGIAGLIAPITVQSSTVWKEIPFSFLAIVILFILANDIFYPDINMLTRLDGVFLLIMFGVFIYYIYKQLKTDQAQNSIETNTVSTIKLFSYIILGLTFLIIGGIFAVDNASKLAFTLGVSEKIIGLTIVAAGTSLPELTTSVVAVLKKNNDIAVGNIIGSNIFNIFLILSVSSIIRPLSYNVKFNTDLLLLAGGTVFLFLAMFTGQKKKLDRWEAVILLVTFIAYTAFLIIQEI
ncbi:calcium/sodium antiporter [bacterium]|nr:calcium/sodium antiporter [bacterium]